MWAHGQAQNLIRQLIGDGKGAFRQAKAGVSLLAIRRQGVVDHWSDPAAFHRLLYAVSLGGSNDVQGPAGLRLWRLLRRHDLPNFAESILKATSGPCPPPRPIVQENQL